MTNLNVAILIGNGFDLSAGLPTSASDFVRHLKKWLKKNDLRNSKIFQSITCNPAGWCDFETQIGRISTKYSDAEEYRKEMVYVDEALYEYIMRANETMTNRFIEQNARDCLYSLASFPNTLPEAIQAHIGNHYLSGGNPNISFTVVNLNYTTVIERMLELAEREAILAPWSPSLSTVCVHPHGTLDTNMIVGVNDTNQLKNSSFANDALVQKDLIKPCLANDCNAAAYAAAQDAFKDADIILVLGSSLGKTDRDWFRTIADRLNNDGILLVSLVHGQRESRFHAPGAANVERDRLCRAAGYDIGALSHMAGTIMLAPRDSFLTIRHPIDQHFLTPIRVLKKQTRR